MSVVKGKEELGGVVTGARQDVLLASGMCLAQSHALSQARKRDRSRTHQTSYTGMCAKLVSEQSPG